MLEDRKSAFNATFNTALESLLEYERTNAAYVIKEESIAGAKKFISGIGKHGKSYNLTDKELPDWERNVELNPKHKL